MSSNRDRGSVLVADLVLGCALVLIIAAAASAAGIIVDTTQSSREAARMGAVAIARGWEPEGALIRARALAPPESTITAELGDGSAQVDVSVVAELPHPIARRMSLPVSATVIVPIAPYRSRRDG